MVNGQVAIYLALTFALAFATTALLLPWVMRLSTRYGWVQQPGGRRQHARPTSNIGGVAIYCGFVAALLLTFAFEPVLPRSSFERLRLLLLLIGATLIFLVMWRDDIAELPPLPKFAAQLAAALIAVGPYLWEHRRYSDAAGQLTEARGIVLTAFKFPFVDQVNLWDISPWLAIGATVLWIGWMTNTINWSDGIDGLAGGVSLIAALALALNALRQSPPQITIALLPLALAGAAAGFLLFNFPPATIFMGDSGAELLGYVLGVSAIIGGAKLATVLLVLGVPILDVAWLVIARLRAGRSPAQGGRDHLHFRLRDMGCSPRQVLLFYYALSASFGLLGIVSAAPIVKLAALGVLALIVIAVITYVSRRTVVIPRP
ncbi:MAG: undecaprenyl/decaprenyl-phosphate alpha-N-acetylglucosaminyl 1-phosphate transferase [Kouleothrix sp.]|jgi:UDP-N-acetylmuramyl pentapeptide phosphotransferase/UDP-N-acetylglucosamine-1-phosphate transferase|nr:undecaprenyl/decaprenyl-phosphate alpha-N-acetylglucosaminyl 1-phosphate transferase [Kouleothrix sp.]